MSWPLGDTRSDISAEDLAAWPALRRRIANELGLCERGAEPMRATQRGLAAWLGVQSKTVSRWMAGTRTPMARHYRAMRRWIAKRLA